MTAQEFAPVLDAFIKRHDRFILCGHVRPDGDSVASCLAMAYVLKAAGKEPQIYYEGDISHYFWLDQPFEVLNADTLLKATRGKFAWMVLDAADPARTGEAAVCFDLCQESLCIDHHVTKGYADHNLIVPEATSASEVIFRVLEQMNYPFGKPEATALFTGIAFDTGGFRHSSMRPEIYGIADTLAEAGAPITPIMNGLFHTRSLLEQKVRGTVLAKAKLYHGRIVAAEMEGKDLLRLGAGPNHCEGVVADLMEVEEAEAAVFLRELENGQIRVNMRSKEYVDVAACAKHFGGGGHVRAAGCTLPGPMLLAKKQILEELEKQLVPKA